MIVDGDSNLSVHRYRRLQAVEGARSRAREYEDALTEKVLHQVSASQEDHRRAKARRDDYRRSSSRGQHACREHAKRRDATTQLAFWAYARCSRA